MIDECGGYHPRGRRISSTQVQRPQIHELQILEYGETQMLERTPERELTSLEKKQQTLADMTRMVARKQFHSLFVIGGGGTGKSRTITRTLEDEGQETILLNSNVTQLELFRLMYHHSQNDLIFLFDDVDGIFRSPVHLGLLRSALYGHPERIVTYSSSTLPDDLPPSFSTISRFIFLANQVPKKCPMFDAVLTRCLVYRLDLSNQEIVEQFRVMAGNGYPGVLPEECDEIIDFIEANGQERQLSMRLLTPAIQIFKFAKMEGTDWRPALLAQLQNLGRPTVGTVRAGKQQQDFAALEQVIRQHPESVSDQQEAWCKQTGKSRATFYRALSRYRQAHDS